MKGAEGSEHLKMKANQNDKENVCIFWGKMLSILTTGRLLYHFTQMP